MFSRILSAINGFTEPKKVWVHDIKCGPIGFSLLNYAGKQSHPFVSEPERLHGYVREYLLFAKPIISLDRLSIAVYSRNSIDTHACLEFINYFSKKIGGTKIRIATCIDERIAIFEGPYIWINAPQMLSMFALIVSSGLLHNSGVDPSKTIQSAPNRWELMKCLNNAERIAKMGLTNLFYPDCMRNYLPLKGAD